MPNIMISPDPATVGTAVTICVHGLNPGDYITVDLDNGLQPPDARTHQIVVGPADANGGACNGTFTPTADWPSIVVNAPGCLEESVVVTT